MKWLATPGGRGLPRGWRSDDRVFSVAPSRARGRGNRLTKGVVYVLRERGRVIGRPFATARLAKAFADAYVALGDDRRARAEFVRNGGQWCWDKESEWRRERDDKWFRTYRAKSGRVLTDTDIEALADEAERGYDVERLRPLSDERAEWIRKQREGAV